MAGPGATRRQRKRAAICPGPVLDDMIVSILSSSPASMGAYELLDQLKARHALRNAMSVYRSLERLCTLSIVQKVEATSGYRVHDQPNAVLLTCAICGTTISVAADEHCSMLNADAEQAGFRVERLVLEAVGVCSGCEPVPPPQSAAALSRPANAREPGKRHAAPGQERESMAWQTDGMI